jgi:dTDP-4-amino-4,6-dideoxygalactose transaminase
LRFIDLQAQYLRLEREIGDGIAAVLRSGQYIQGAEVEELERQLAIFVGVDHCISCASGTDALVIALMAKGIGPGDGVLTTPFTFMASAEAIALVGATPIFVDVDPITYNICPVAIERVLRACDEGDPSIHPLPAGVAAVKPKAIITVDLFGLPADYPQIAVIARRHGLFVIEDAAQSFGAMVGNRRAGGLAEIACTSFFPAKPLGCYGDGGAIFTDDSELADIFRSIRVHGQGRDRYEHVRLGLTGRLDTIQAAVLLAKMTIFEDELERRNDAARAYLNALAEAGLDLVLPRIPAGHTSAWAQFSVLARDASHRAELQARLGDASIPTGIYYPCPLHLQPAFASLGYEAGDFPVSEDLASRIFALPMHAYLQPEQIDMIVRTMADQG